jgi:hypothetical protein
MMYLKDIAKKYVLNGTTLIEVDVNNIELLEYVLDRKVEIPLNCKYYGNGIVKNNPSFIKLSEIID